MHEEVVMKQRYVDRSAMTHEAEAVHRSSLCEPKPIEATATPSSPPPAIFGSRLSADGILRLQRSIGNAQVARLLSTRQEGRSPVYAVLGRGGGQPLSPPTRQLMESRLGHDFSDVRVHCDGNAVDSARSVGAQAYTVGNDVVLGPGVSNLDSRDSHRLLAHELTHVVQQRSGEVSGRPAAGGIKLSDPGDPFEREAEQVAERVVAGDVVGLQRSASANDSDPDAGQPDHAPTNPVVQRHASDEHYFLGDVSPAQIKVLSEGTGLVAGKKGPKAFEKAQAKGQVGATDLEARDDALHLIENELEVLTRWLTTGGPNPHEIGRGTTGIDPKWKRQLVVVQTKDGPVVASIGDLNALPDFFGSPDDLKLVSATVARRTFQVIRREAYASLVNLRAKLDPQGHVAYDREAQEAATPFVGLADDPTHVRGTGMWDKIANLADEEKMTGGPGGISQTRGANATLARNACHFPPESWLRWKALHEEARDLIENATLDDIDARANEAIYRNAFGEHYLQDSFASGHLINKSYVMATAIAHSGEFTNLKRRMSKSKFKHIRNAVRHEEAYEAPALAKQVAEGTASHQQVSELGELKAIDPQTAYEAGRAEDGEIAAKEAEVKAAGLDPKVVTWDQYRVFVNDGWYQIITNVLHDKYCIEGLVVGSPDRKEIGRIYGDAHMLESPAGAVYTAETTQMSRDAINGLVRNKRSALMAAAERRQAAGNGPGQAGGGRQQLMTAHRRLATPVPAGAVRSTGRQQLMTAQRQVPVPAFRRPLAGGQRTIAVAGTEAILARFPNTVYVPTKGGRKALSLVDWATGPAMRREIAEIVDSLFTSSVFKTNFVRFLSAMPGSKSKVSPGLDPSHGPF
jgi:hypothetical protein